MPLKNGRTSAALQQILVGSIIPPGTIQAFGGGTVPSGWLLCDGSTTNRSTYSALFSAIGVAHGSGNGSTTFHLPDLRGRLLRGADNMGTGAAGRDPDAATRTAGNSGGNSGDAVGSVQSDAMQGHEFSSTTTLGNGTSGAGNAGMIPNNGTTTGVKTSALNFVTDGTNGTPRVSSESRPQNLAVEYIIKA